MLQLLNENENEILGSTDVGSSWHNMIIWLVAGREAGVSPLNSSRNIVTGSSRSGEDTIRG